MAVLLTEMGCGVVLRLLALRRADAIAIGQDIVANKVFGMPRVAKDIGAFGSQIALPDISDFILKNCVGDPSKNITGACKQ